MMAHIVKIARYGITLALVVYAGISLYMFIFQKRYVFVPEKRITLTPQDCGLEYENFILHTGDGLNIYGWFVPSREHKKYLLFMHGNAGNLSSRVESLELLGRLGFSTFIIDYRGYGESQGSPSERGLYLDAHALWEWVTHVRGISPEQIVIFGESLGGAVAAWMAKEFHPAALILQGTFTSTRDMGKILYPYLPIRFCLVHRFPAVEYIRQVSCPALIIHSSEDEVVPYAFGQKLFDNAPAPKDFLAVRGNHGDAMMISWPLFENKIRKFMDQYVD